jgi:hypothetical protein
MECKQRLHLQRNYTTASAIFDAATVQVHRGIGIWAESEFEMLRHELDWASAQVESARAALEAHLRDHCCMVRGITVRQD